MILVEFICFSPSQITYMYIAYLTEMEKMKNKSRKPRFKFQPDAFEILQRIILEAEDGKFLKKFNRQGYY